MSGRQEVDWERLDKRKFFVHGAGIFSGLTAALFPLTVIKTRMMALDGSPTGLGGAIITGRDIVRHDGVRGLYRGFGTVLFGAIPARILYLATLESTKSGLTAGLARFTSLPDTAIATSASFAAGAAASLAGQLVVVPMDVISQRLMIRGGPQSTAAAAAATGTSSITAPGSITSTGARVNGFTLGQKIIQREGIRGLYRGFGASLATFVPSNAIWWGTYGGWQTALWHQWDRWGNSRATPGGSKGVLSERTESQILGIQVVAGVLTGCTSAFFTTPMDVVKTRLQTRESAPDLNVKMTWRGTANELLKAEGFGGFFRGVAPRMMSTSIWGTAMVTTYEFLKRLCMLPPSD